ncbi:VCBS repeat-containing protein [Niastella sp. OAS944]|uniref:VCBS repeat-containing protein n=1 Tax=Niastella sp. OAS944 TaxID=2664089 RepID=UPI0035C7ACE5|nr:hypothetical protein [Chitinophagaceae bacterium OAS944]
MYINRSLVCLLTGFVFSLACKNNKEAPATLFELVENTGINFTNPVVDQEYDNSFLFRNFYNGGGVAIGDINNDGLADILLTSNMEENKLYLNKGSFAFEDITAKSGMKQDSMWSTGAVMADINNDGWLDMYICNSGHMKSGRRRNKLYINNHNLTFTEAAAQYGLNISAYTTQVSFFDYDLDGDLDCFMIDNSPMPVNTLGYTNQRDLPAKEWQVADFVKDGGDHLYRNDNGRFTEVNKEAGIHGTLMSFGLGVSVGDVNNDGYPDIYVANDSYERDYLYVNQKNGTFKDEMEKCMKQNSFSSMGADIGDINNDGYADIFTTDMLPDNDYRLKTLGAFDNIDQYRNKLQIGFYHQYMKNCLQLNNGNGTFSDVANYSGVCASDWSWGALLFDADNDGLNDIYICNGVNRDVTDLDFMEFFANDVIQKMVLTGKKEKVNEVLEHIPKTPVINKAYKNLGSLRFADAGNSWGFTQTSFSNGAAYGDLDNDGDLDLVINNINQQAFIYKNRSREQNSNHYISILLKGHGQNTYAIGSKIMVHTGGAIITREVVPSRGFQSSVDYKQVIGLGRENVIDSIVVMWPNRTVTTFIKPAIDTTHIFTQKAGIQHLLPDSVQNNTWLFTAIPQAFEKHVEDDNVDFYYERNIPEILSREGPKVATADVNGDGLSDMYIGGTKSHPGQLYLQQKSGGFKKKGVPVFLQFKDFEDEAVLFFDCDRDGDADLFVGPGGNNSPPYSREMQCRLMKNDGNGSFTLDATALHTDGMNTAVAAAYDFDNDGDLDLFVGSRSTPRNYGVTPTSYLFVNNGNGQFTDMAKAKNPNIATIGMVTGAVWANVAGDEAKELIITGEWMAPRIFSYKGDRFAEVKSNLNELYGLWQTVVATDVNNDGKTDLVLGNIGDNFYLHPNKENPVKLWINDFNNNGSEDKVLTRTADKRDVPVFLKKEMQEEIPTIKKENLKNKDYAKRSIQELFSKELIDKSNVRLFNYTSSCIAVNNGNGSFTVQPLPYQVQLSMMSAILCADLNKDGFTDMVLGGNKSGFPPQFGKLDASYGEVLINNGNGGFAWLPPRQTGLLVDGEVRDISLIAGAGNNYVLFARNDDYPVLYKLKK